MTTPKTDKKEIEKLKAYINRTRKQPRNCSWGVKCELKVKDLGKAVAPDTYFCSVCENKVYDCHSKEAFEAHVAKGHCVLFNKDWLPKKVQDDEEQLMGYPDFPNFLRKGTRL